MSNHKTTEGSLWKTAIMEVMNFFISICEKYHIRYYAGYGTVLGAVRHRGFIPWDDDIDILMPRPDYKKFLLAFEKEKVDKYKLCIPSPESNYYTCYAKICKSGATLLETNYLHYVVGPFVDIFVLDGCSGEREKAKHDYDLYQKYIRKYQTSVYYMPFSFYIKKMLKLKWGYLIDTIISRMFPSAYRMHYLKLMSKISNNYKYDESTYVINYCGSYGYKEIIDKKWLSKGEQFLFEGKRIVLPRAYDEYLKNFYDDYMDFPPIEEQHSRHFVAYVDPYHELSYKAVKRIVKEYRINHLF